ncbi:hypothetical protein D3C76_1293030 [compost metagenome]
MSEKGLNGKISKESIKILKIANIVMLLMIVIHDIDHIRQAIDWGYRFTFALLAVNCLVYLTNFIAFLLARQGRFSSAIVTCIGGINTAISFAKVHLLGPSIDVWGPWNATFFELGADAISWWILVITVAVGAGVAMAGMYVLGLEKAKRREIYAG